MHCIENVLSLKFFSRSHFKIIFLEKIEKHVLNVFIFVWHLNNQLEAEDGMRRFTTCQPQQKQMEQPSFSSTSTSLSLTIICHSQQKQIGQTLFSSSCSLSLSSFRHHLLKVVVCTANNRNAFLSFLCLNPILNIIPEMFHIVTKNFIMHAASE